MWNPFHRKPDPNTKLLEAILSGLTDLQAAVTTLGTDVEANTAATTAVVAALGNTGDSDAAVETAAQAVAAANTQIEANTAALTGATPAAPAS